MLQLKRLPPHMDLRAQQLVLVLVLVLVPVEQAE
jgi:hypothetical protein